MILAAALAFSAASGGAWYCFRDPESQPAAPVTVEISRRRLDRGKHVYENVAFCDGCHSLRDYSKFSAPVLVSGRGQVFPRELGLPGRIVAPNITPDNETGIGRWTDGEKIRAIREGVGRDGRALYPMMPYQNYRYMSDEDVYALVAYLNTIPPVTNPLPRTEVDFPESMLIRSFPQPVGYVCEPDRSNPLKLGEYLVRISNCSSCHTPVEDGQPLTGRDLAGGRMFRMPAGTVVSSNITPHNQTGIGSWSRQDFIAKFYTYKDHSAGTLPKVGPDRFTIMPWLAYSRLSPEELGAIYDYLKIQRPVYHPVVAHPVR